MKISWLELKKLIHIVILRDGRAITQQEAEKRLREWVEKLK